MRERPQNTPPNGINPMALLAGTGLLVLTMLLMAGDLAEEFFGSSAGASPESLLNRVQEFLEIGSVFGLGIFTLYLFRVLRGMARHARDREQQLSLLRGQFGLVLDQRFAEWDLTPAERDVTMLIMKGLSVAEIAAARHTADGTVKAQSTSIFRKVGVKSKSALLSTVIDEFLDHAETASTPSAQ